MMLAPCALNDVGAMRIALCSNALGAEPDKYASRCFSTVQLVQRPMPAVLASGH
jgi:hypothetical protein